MQICKNVILPLAIFSTASRLWTPPTRPEHRYRPDSGRSDTVQSKPSVQSLDTSMSSSGSVRLRYEKCLEVWGNTRLIFERESKSILIEGLWSAVCLLNVNNYNLPAISHLLAGIESAVHRPLFDLSLCLFCTVP